jgi:hypothetical protein
MAKLYILLTSTMPTGNGGTKFQGMDGVVIYHRSQDGGNTWDIQGALLPGIDSTAFLGTEVEGYAIYANGNNCGYRSSGIHGTIASSTLLPTMVRHGRKSGQRLPARSLCG